VGTCLYIRSEESINDVALAPYAYQVSCDKRSRRFGSACVVRAEVMHSWEVAAKASRSTPWLAIQYPQIRSSHVTHLAILSRVTDNMHAIPILQITLLSYFVRSQPSRPFLRRSRHKRTMFHRLRPACATPNPAERTRPCAQTRPPTSCSTRTPTPNSARTPTGASRPAAWPADTRSTGTGGRTPSEGD